MDAAYVVQRRVISLGLVAGLGMLLGLAAGGCDKGAATQCGDNFCNPMETCFNCPADCGICTGPVCGDQVCDVTENCQTCAADCGICLNCGDAVCTADESCVTCPEDCTACADTCGDGICGRTESCTACPLDCGACRPVCGDGVCGSGETCESCGVDCGSCNTVCGNGTCEAGELCDVCVADCGTCNTVCGNGTCEGTETCETCVADCGACPSVCGDGTCDTDEECDVCVADCGECPPVCGDGVCEGTENLTNCPDDCDDWPSAWATKEMEILTQINAFRASPHSCGGVSFPAAGPLTMNAQLRLAARGHAQDMADQDYFAHDSLDGRTFSDRIQDAGFTGGYPWGENIAAGNAGSTDTMDQWINSPGHCENMMNGDFSTIGIGYAYNASSTYSHYWVQDFGN